MPLTAQDVHEAFLKTYKENYQDSAPWTMEWNALNDKEKLCYDRMAELLNEKAGQPQPIPASLTEAPAMMELIWEFIKDHIVAKQGELCDCNFCREGRAIAHRIMEAK